MPEPIFIHLRLHSEFSIVDGTVRIDAAVARAAADRMPALALTDLSNLFGMVKFYGAARSAGVKPIIGCDVWVSNESDRDKPYRLLLLAQSREGYLWLCALLTRAYRENQHRGRAEVRAGWFDADGTDGLIALSGAHFGDVGQALTNENGKLATELAQAWSRRFPDRFYLELQRTGAPQAETHVRRALRLASRTGLPVVATHPVQFLDPAEFRAHEARVCIAEGHVLADQRRPRRFTEQQSFLTQAEMAARFADCPQALANSVEIARRCNVTLELGKSKLPPFPTPDGSGLEDYLRRRAAEGLVTRMASLYPDEAQCEAKRPQYEARLEFELGTIIKMGFPGYFLIVADFINWAKSNGIPVGPGRGSGAGSLVAYSLGITDLDPLRYDLLFERFLNPERVSMPDFDIDFCQDGRDRVIDYVRTRYGADCVSQIATFGTMAAKAVVRDVGRVMEWGYNRTDELAKLIPFQPGKLITLEMAREMEPRLKEREQTEEDTRDLLALAGQLEGLARNVGMHAGGVLIAPGKLTDFCPLYTAAGSDHAVSQFDKDDVEAVGLVKFDFLGLTTLTILDWTVRHVRARTWGERFPDFSITALPLDDAATYRVFASANTTAVFQFESRGMRDLLKQARPDRFEDIIALVALYRPGPMDLIPEFNARKHGKRFEYLDSRLEPILGNTYGIMVYQEQVMQIAQVIGGYSLGAADLLRRAMGKKKPEEMAQHRGIFVEGAQRDGASTRTATDLFDLMEKFAGYGFNKSHAAAYALVAYQTAYMKAHFPAEFMAANMSAVMDDTDKVRLFHEDAVANRLRVLAPDINSGVHRFVPVDAQTIRYGLGGVKGTGAAAIEAVVAARESGGPFRDLFDFCARVDKRVVNRRAIEALIRAGAFDSLDANRARMLASTGIAMEAAEQRERNAMQVSLFGDADVGSTQTLAPVPTRPWDEVTRLREEKTALGFYFSGHPFTAYGPEVRQFARTTLKRLATMTGGYGGYGSDQGQPTVLVAGVIQSLRLQKSLNGRMAIVNLSDGTATVELTVYGEVFEEHRDKLTEDGLVVVEVKVRTIRRPNGDEGESVTTRFIVERVYDLAGARNRFAQCLRIRCNGNSETPRLRELLAPYRADGRPVVLVYSNRGAECELRLGDDWRVNLHDGLVQSLGAWVSPENVEVIYP